MAFLSSIVAFAIVLGIIVLVHEFGHYIAARLMGVRVEVFSFGFGKRLLGRQIGETDFRLSLIPLGGYVKMAGEEEFDPENLKPYEFHAKNRGQKIFILIMGPLMNLLLAFLIFTILNISGVQTTKYTLEPPQIGYVMADSAAEKAGLRKGDLILTIDGRDVPTWRDLELTIGANPDESLPVTYRRDGERKTTTLNIRADKRTSIGDAGIFWEYGARIDSVAKDSPAHKAGFKDGDIILSVNDQPVNFFNFRDHIAPNAGKTLVFRVKREEEEMDLEVIPEEETVEDETKGMIGVMPTLYAPTVIIRYGVLDAMVKSKNDIVKLTFFIFNALKKMIVGKISAKQLSGPMEIARFSQKAMKQGPSSFFMLIAFISLQLGLINLLPIPALDGGHLMIFSIEALIRRDFSDKVKNILLNVGFLLLISLMVFVILNDVAKLLPNGWSSFWPF